MSERIESKVTPEVLQIIYLDEIASRLADLQATMESLELRVLDVHEIQKAEITEGIIEGVEIDVTDQLKPLLRESGYKEKWFEITIFNDGADDVYVSSAETRHEKPLIIRNGDSAKIEAKKGTRNEVYVYCKKGENATIRVSFQR